MRLSSPLREYANRSISEFLAEFSREIVHVVPLYLIN